MRRHSIYTCFVVFVLTLGVLWSCQKHLNVKDVISIHAASNTPLADGSTQDLIYADLPVDALAAFRGVTFKASSGLFDNGADTMSVFANRTDVTVGKITAVVTWHASLRSGLDTLSASTSTVPQQTDYLYLTLAPSTASTIQLTPSTYTVTNEFGAQVTISGRLRNSDGGMVSQGVKVQFSDFADGTNSPAGGSFISPVVTMDTGSIVSTVYFPPQLTDPTTGAYIVIKATVLDASGNPTGTTVSIRIFVSPRQN
ncbi:MAG TPA: hypothetical protein VHE34_25765 [Puia sp.]|uniref:hypothetical protein n=1 Tax=Puia sp. TaxID=2045100 RepID=UPI002BE763F7|nr:hypothetical protein [Puia sp.]HVU98666.1 hypothetical protein [Puia sp.]